MARKNGNITSLIHRDEPSFPLDPGILPRIHTMTAKHKNGDKTTGYGWSREGACEDLGKRISQGKRDKK
jgi:hypothetical protein